MSSMPILDPVPEPMDTDVPSEEVRHSVLCMCVYCNILMVMFKVLFSVYIVVFRVEYYQIVMYFGMW